MPAPTWELHKCEAIPQTELRRPESVSYELLLNTLEKLNQSVSVSPELFPDTLEMLELLPKQIWNLEAHDSCTESIVVSLATPMKKSVFSMFDKNFWKLCDWMTLECRSRALAQPPHNQVLREVAMRKWVISICSAIVPDIILYLLPAVVVVLIVVVSTISCCCSATICSCWKLC